MKLKTTSGIELTVKSNKKARTFTIKKNGAKYRTNPVSFPEFNEMENFTGNDWQDYLRNSGDYYVVG